MPDTDAHPDPPGPPLQLHALMLLACTPRALDEMDNALQEAYDTGDAGALGAFIANGWPVLGRGLARLTQAELEVAGESEYEREHEEDAGATPEGTLARAMMRAYPGIFALLGGHAELRPDGDLQVPGGVLSLAPVLRDLLQGLAVATLDLGGYWDVLSYALDEERRQVQEFEPFALGMRSLVIRGEAPLILGGERVESPLGPLGFLRADMVDAAAADVGELDIEALALGLDRADVSLASVYHPPGQTSRDPQWVDDVGDLLYRLRQFLTAAADAECALVMIPALRDA